MNMRWRVPSTPAALAALVLAGAWLPPASRAQDAADLPTDATLGDFLRVAEEGSRGLEGSRRQWRAEVEAAGAAGSFPDPELSFEFSTRVEPREQRVALRQRLPWFGKLGLHETVAHENAEAAHARHEDDRVALRRDVTLAWLELYWLGSTTELTRRNLELLIDLEQVIRERYRIARAAHADLMRVQVEMGVVENDLRSVEDRLRPAIARMNELLHRPERAPVPVPSELPEWPSAPDAETVFVHAREGSFRLEEWANRVEEAEAARRLAERSRWPDWMVGAEWIRMEEAQTHAIEDDGKDPIMLSVSVSLPIFRGKWDAPARAAEERVAAAEAGLSQQEDELIARVEDVLYEWRDADRRLDLYESALLPKARESYQALDAAYRSGNGAFLDLIEAQRMLLSFELETERALTDRGRSAAVLAYLTGGSPETEATP